MPRAKPPPRATPIPGVQGVDSAGAESLDSSLPKAWTDRMIPLKDFTGAPHPGCPEKHFLNLVTKMPLVVQMVQTTLVLSLVTELLPRHYPPLWNSAPKPAFVTNSFIPVNLCGWCASSRRAAWWFGACPAVGGSPPLSPKRGCPSPPPQEPGQTAAEQSREKRCSHCRRAWSTPARNRKKLPSVRSRKKPG